MSGTVIYGINNCDTMKKAMTWLTQQGVRFTFHDYKTQGVDETVLRRAINDHGWGKVINQRGTTWRKLPDDVKSAMDDTNAIALAKENPSVIKRPLLLQGDQIHLGFDPAGYSEMFS